MNSKTSAQILYSSFVLLLIIVESLQTPITEEKRANHKLMRFGRAPHQLIHFGKRAIDEDSSVNFGPNDISNDQNEDFQREYLLRLLLSNLSQDNINDDEATGQNYMSSGITRRSIAKPSPFYSRKFFYKKGGPDRDNVFMHFG